MANLEFPRLKGKLILAPMHNVTNVAFRLLCKKYGASLVSTELLSANALSCGNKAVMKLGLSDKKEKPNVIQIFGQNIDNIVKAAKVIEKEMDFDLIDFNLGCPSQKIMAQGSGGALLKRPKKIKDILKALVESVKIPVTVKIRSGFSDKENAVEIAKICKEVGVSAIIVHARTVEQGYSGKAKWNVIKKVKDAVDILVIGNGDVWNGEDAKMMLEETGCDYVMIGRAAIGNPFIFKKINDFLEKGEVVEQSKEEKIADYFEYINLCKKFEIFSLSDSRLRAQEFTKGLAGSVRLRRELNKVKSWEEVDELMKRLVDK